MLLIVDGLTAILAMKEIAACCGLTRFPVKCTFLCHTIYQHGVVCDMEYVHNFMPNNWLSNQDKCSNTQNARNIVMVTLNFAHWLFHSACPSVDSIVGNIMAKCNKFTIFI